MTTEERAARRAENRDINQLEAEVIDLRRLFGEQFGTLNETIQDHRVTLDTLAENMAERNGSYRGANIALAPFYGNRDEDFAQYLKQFELVCQANNYDVDKRAQILASYLRDKAFYIYDSLTVEQKTDYDQLKAALNDKFQTTDYRRYAHQKFQSRKQQAGENVSEYGCAVHKLGMAALANIEADQRDALIREKFISGLLPHLHELIVYSNPKNFHEAMTLAERLEGLQASKGDTNARNVMLLERIHDRLSHLEMSRGQPLGDPAQEITCLVENQNRRPLGRTGPAQVSLNNFRQQYRPSGMVCYKCNRTGHMARNCGRHEDRSNIVCRRCNMFGHFARDCQKRMNIPERKAPNAMNNLWRCNPAMNRTSTQPRHPIGRAMAITTPQAPYLKDPTGEIQSWKPLVGAIKTTKTDNKGWKIVQRPVTTKGSNPSKTNVETTTSRQPKVAPGLRILASISVILMLSAAVAGTSLTYKPSAPMVCQANQAKTLWQLPKSFNCPEGNHTSDDDVKTQKFQLYKQNHIQYKSKAWKCIKITEEVETFTYFFGDENLKRQKKYNQPVSSEECITMKRYKRCGNDQMVYQGGIYQTNNRLSWYYPGGGINCCKWKQFQVTNCFMYESYVYKRHDSTSMESAAGDVSGCSYVKGQCLLQDDAYLLWDVNNKSFCQLLPWKTVPGSSYGTSWLSDDSNLALTFTRKLQTKDCTGNPLLLSDQGIAVKPASSDRRIRKKRQLTPTQLEAFRSVVGTGGVVSSAQLASSMQALELRWRRNTNFAFSHALNSVCNFMRSVVELLRTQVLADPTNAIRALTNQSDIFVRSGGNVIEIYPCHQLPNESYQFMPMNQSCTAQIPIKFQITNKTATGYLDPLTNIIHRYASPIDCNLIKEVPLQIAGTTYIYRSDSGQLQSAHEIPTLKVLQWNVEPIVDMKATIFHEIVIYSWKELQTHINMNDIIGGLTRQQAILKRLGITAEASDVNEAAEKAVGNIMDVGYFGFLRGLSLNFFQVWTFCINLYVTIGIIMIHCCPITMAHTMLNIPNMCKEIKDRVTKLRGQNEPPVIIPEPSAPKLLQRFSREFEESMGFNQHEIPNQLQRLPNRVLRALPPPQLKSFSASADLLTDTGRKVHNVYPSMQLDATHGSTEIQPFHVNIIASTNQTLVDTWVDDISRVATLVDSGAAVTILSERAAKKLGKHIRQYNHAVLSATGHELEILGQTDVSIRFGNVVVHGPVVVSTKCKPDLIFGVDFMKKVGNVNLNFKERVIQLNKDILYMKSTKAEAMEADRHRLERFSSRIPETMKPPLGPTANHCFKPKPGMVKMAGNVQECPIENIFGLPLTLRNAIDRSCRYRMATGLNEEPRQLHLNGLSNKDTRTCGIHNGNVRHVLANRNPKEELTEESVVDGITTEQGSPFESHAETDAPLQVNATEGTNDSTIEAYVEGIKVRSLVDTGSSLTIVPVRIAKLFRNPIKPASVEAISMTGHQLPVIGETKTIIRIGTHDIEGTVIVTRESPYSLILGTDLIKQFGSITINFAKQIARIGTEIVPMNTMETLPRVLLCQSVKIPARSTVSVMGYCYGLTPDDIEGRAACCFSPSDKLLNKYDVISQQSVVVPYEKIVPVTVTNCDHAPKYMPEKASLGVLEILDDDGLNSVNRQDTTDDLIIMTGPKRSAEEMERFRENIRLSEDLDTTDKNLLRQLIENYEKLFTKNEYDLGETTLVEHSIDTGDARPIKQRPYRTPHSLRPYLSTKIEEMRRHGIIQPSKSDWSSPVVLVRKKNAKELRFCVDNRKLNDVTVKDNYPLKRIEDAFDMLHGARYFACLDLQSGYWQIPVKRTDQCKTAFVTIDGLYEFTKMNFGLCNAPATFQRLMDQVLRGLDLKTCMSYIDDIIVPANSINQLMQRLEEVFKRLVAAGLKLKLRKCKFGAKKLHFLGFVVSEQGLQVDPEKVNKILNAAAPKTLNELRTFLGFAGWCKRFVEGYAKIAQPLTKLLMQDKPYAWNEDAQNAFKELKSRYAKPPILAYPDMQQPFIICTDASNLAIGAVLCQYDSENQERPISYDSRVLGKSERNYSTIEKEMLAIFWAVTKKYRVYVYGHDFTVFTDHKPLLGVWNSPPSDGRLGRWCVRMQEYRINMTLEYREGKANVAADYLSRLPEDPELQTTKLVLACPIGEDNLSIQQTKDPVFGPIIKYITEGELPTGKRRAEQIERLATSYEIVEDTLYKRSDKYDKLVVALPGTLQRKALIANHDSLLGGHLGVRKTLSKIEKKYYWPGCYNDVVKWCRTCMACQRRKTPIRPIKAPMKPIAINYINQKWAWDICGPLPVSRQGNKYILVCIEYFSKFPEVFAVPDTKAERLAKIWVENIVLRYGSPEVLISDQGANVHSSMIQQICKLLDIDKLRTSAYHPQSDGMVERFNRTLQHMISMYVNDGNTDWCELLPFVTFAYRASVHESTRESPFFLMYGYDPELPMDTSIMPSNLSYVSTEDDYKLFVLTSLLKSRKLVSDHILQAQCKQKRHYDSTAKEHVFLQGDRVLVFTPSVKKGRSKKFAKRWKGPYRIVEVSSNGTNILIQPIGSRRNKNQVWIHVNRAKRLLPEPNLWPLPDLNDQVNSDTEGEINRSVPDPSLNNSQGTLKGSEVAQEKCARCHKRGKPGKWVACDTCNKWYHYACVGLMTDPPGTSWHCHSCQGNAPYVEYHAESGDNEEDVHSDSSVETENSADHEISPEPAHSVVRNSVCCLVKHTQNNSEMATAWKGISRGHYSDMVLHLLLKWMQALIHYGPDQAEYQLAYGKYPLHSVKVLSPQNMRIYTSMRSFYSFNGGGCVISHCSVSNEWSCSYCSIAKNVSQYTEFHPVPQKKARATIMSLITEHFLVPFWVANRICNCPSE